MCFKNCKEKKRLYFCTFHLASHSRAVCETLRWLQLTSYLLHLVCLVSSGVEVVFFFLHLSQYLSLNEIGYGNVESCGRVVSADVVEPGRVETGTYSSEKQTVADADTSLQAGHIKPETRACTLQRYYSGNKHILEIKRRKQYGEKEGECLQS